MFEALSQNPHLIPGVTAIVFVFGTIVAIVGLVTWRKHQAAKMEIELKMEMLARGMSADEIERVLAAKSTGNAGGTSLPKTLQCANH